MKEKKINFGLIIFIVIVVILFLPIIIDYVNSRNITVITSQELSNKMDEGTENFIVYVGKTDKTVTKELRKIREKTLNDYSYKYSVYSVEDSKDIETILGDKTEVAFIIEGDIQKVYDEYNYSEVDEYADIYFVGNITDDNKSYKVVDSFNEYKKLVKSDDVTMAIFGYTGCYHCGVFKTVYNAVAEKYGIDIYYFDSTYYDADELKKIQNMDLTIPAKCSSNNVEFKLSDGYGTPLTIFTKKGKVVDCIGGRVDRSRLVEQLKSLELISE